MIPRSAIVAHPDLLLYDFGPYHPLRPERITAGFELLELSGLWDPQTETIAPERAAMDELESVHSAEYIQAVVQAGGAGLPQRERENFGFGSSDNPPFPHMHEVSALVAGGAGKAVREIMNGRLDHVFHPAGGLHHASRSRASGFCIYNDPAFAAAVAAREFDARVMSIDLDCHHGDGVQWIHYDNPDIFTLSFHESGRFLFPGTGEITERGEGSGLGACLNVPFAPFTGDDSWRAALTSVVPAIAHSFQPDIIISNHGCDTHAWDPLTHLSLTTASFQRQVALVHELAHELCDGRWLAVGSGGYDWRRVVPRSWAMLWAEMSERTLPDALPAGWVNRWLAGADVPRPTTFRDTPALSGKDDNPETRSGNDRTLAAVHRIIAGMAHAVKPGTAARGIS